MHSPAERPLVLCVDDEPSVLAALYRTLRRFGCEVLTTDDGASALEILRQRTVDVLLCDAVMHGLDGNTVLRRAAETSPATVRIMLTGMASETDIVNPAISEGEIFRLFAKPWDDEALCRAIADALGFGIDEWNEGYGPARVDAV